MKFPQLPLGQSFSWQGEVYCKTGPIAATHSATGQTRMIPRSASVSPLGESRPAPPLAPPAQIDPARAVAALETLHRRCLELLEPRLPADAAAELVSALNEALETQRAALLAEP
jgi:hypothetical protein